MNSLLVDTRDRLGLTAVRLERDQATTHRPMLSNIADYIDETSLLIAHHFFSATTPRPTTFLVYSTTYTSGPTKQEAAFIKFPWVSR
jgi:hypothetical protein